MIRFRCIMKTEGEATDDDSNIEICLTVICRKFHTSLGGMYTRVVHLTDLGYSNH